MKEILNINTIADLSRKLTWFFTLIRSWVLTFIMNTRTICRMQEPLRVYIVGVNVWRKFRDKISAEMRKFRRKSRRKPLPCHITDVIRLHKYLDRVVQRAATNWIGGFQWVQCCQRSPTKWCRSRWNPCFSTSSLRTPTLEGSAALLNSLSHCAS